MPTQLEIYNRAMAAMSSRNTIGSTVETSVEAEALNQHYDGLRRELLESWPWSFARRVGALTVFKSHPSAPSSVATGTTWNSTWPSPPWIYEYSVPTSFIRARFVTPKTGNTALTTLSPIPSNDIYYTMNPPYRFSMGSDVSGSDSVRVLFTDVADAVLIYTADITDIDGWGYQFTQAFVHLLAGRIAAQLSTDLEIVKLNIALGENYLGRAKQSDANEGLTPTTSVPDWIRARGLNVSDPDAGFV